MSDRTKGSQALTSSMPWLVPAVVAGVGLVAAISYIRSQETHAASGSPLYGRAVGEAITGLKNPAEKVAAARPALPAGLSPADHYWCEQCKAYHKRQVEGQPAGVAPPSLAAGTPETPLAAAAGTIPPLPAGLAAEDYYWCPDCKAYHKRQPDQGQPAAAAHPPAAEAHAAPAAAHPEGTIPPLPAGLSPNDYYWCPNCKAYHLRQPATPATPAGGTAPATPAPATPAPATPAPATPAPATPAPATPAPATPAPATPAPATPAPATPAPATPAPATPAPATPAVPDGETQPAPVPPASPGAATAAPEATPAAPPAVPPATEASK